jgi:hypothetical protein
MDDLRYRVYEDAVLRGALVAETLNMPTAQAIARSSARNVAWKVAGWYRKFHKVGRLPDELQKILEANAPE